MVDDSGILSLDFIVGFTIFMISFIIVATMISGLLVGLQAKTIDYDAVAYRTGVILVEDPGYADMRIIHNSQTPDHWELLPPGSFWNSKLDIKRLGLSVSKDTPNILSPSKVQRFFDASYFGMSKEEYRSRLIFGDYPYSFHISLASVDGSDLAPGLTSPQNIGETPPQGASSIRRVVWMKQPSNMQIDILNPGTHDPPIEEHDLPHPYIAVSLKPLELNSVSEPYRLDLAQEQITIVIQNAPREPTATIRLDFPDGTPMPDKQVLVAWDPLTQTVISVFEPGFFEFENVDPLSKYYITYEFIGAVPDDPLTYTGIYNYDYTDPHLTTPPATPPNLNPVAVLEVEIW